MALDRTIAGLKLLKPAVKLIPVAGTYLEGAVDVIQQSCEIAQVGDLLPAQLLLAPNDSLQGVRTNRSDWTSLHERISLCVAVIAKELQRATAQSLNTRLGDVQELLRHVLLRLPS
jgi:hypothetical protein